MGPLDHFDPGLGLHFLDYRVLVGAVVEKTGADVDGIDGFAHGRHPGFELNETEDGGCARAAAAVDESSEVGVRPFVALEFTLLFVESHQTAMAPDTGLILDVLAAQDRDVLHGFRSYPGLVWGRDLRRTDLEVNHSTKECQVKGLSWFPITVPLLIPQDWGLDGGPIRNPPWFAAAIAESTCDYRNVIDLKEHLYRCNAGKPRNAPVCMGCCTSFGIHDSRKKAGAGSH